MVKICKNLKDQPNVSVNDCINEFIIYLGPLENIIRKHSQKSSKWEGVKLAVCLKMLVPM